MQCMLVYNQTNLLMGGHHTKMLELDLTTGEGKGEYEVENPGLAILRANSRFLYCGDTSGKVSGITDRNDTDLVGEESKCLQSWTY